jgi:hypothetical protein
LVQGFLAKMPVFIYIYHSLELNEY